MLATGVVDWRQANRRASVAHQWRIAPSRVRDVCHRCAFWLTTSRERWTLRPNCVGLCGPVEVRWANRVPAHTAKSRHRQRNAGVPASRRLTRPRLAPLLHDGTIAYEKVDSLMRHVWPGLYSPPALDSAPGAIASWRPRSRTRSAERRAGDNSREAEMVRGAPPAPISRQNCVPEASVAVRASLTDTLRRWDLCLRRGNRGRSRPRRGCRPPRSGTGDLVRQPRRPCPRARPRS